MKKILILLLTVVLCCTFMSGCAFYQRPDNSDDSDGSKMHLAGDPSDIIGGDDLNNEKTPRIDIETPPDDYVYMYDSYTDILSALSLSSSSEYVTLRNEQANYGVLFSNTLKQFGSGDAVLLVPEIDGDPIDLRDTDGYSGVSLMTCELYNLPWIWYHCVIDECSLDVKIAYPDALESDVIDLAKTYLDILELIAPDAPSPSNYQQYESYKTIYEKDVTLADGQVVTAMISEMNNTSKIYVMLFLNDSLVSLYADAELFSESFWNSFGLAAYDGT